MIEDYPEGIEQMRKNVISPGGTTEAGLNVLMEGDVLKAILTRAFQAARDRAMELT